MKRVTCGACGSAGLTQVLNLGATPLADVFPATPARSAVSWYPLGLCLCPRCELVQLTEVVDDAELFGVDYGFLTGASPAAVQYFADYAAEVGDQFTWPGTVVEVACNDGTMLANFARAGWEAIGVDPAGPAVAAARARPEGLTVYAQPFTSALAEGLAVDHSPDLVIANNVLAHARDPHDFAAGLAILKGSRGVLAIEVQYVGDLLLGNMFDHVYHEHRSFFSMASLQDLLVAHGLVPRQVRRTAGQGGSLRVLCGEVDEDNSVAELVRRERGWLRSRDAWAGFQGRVDAIRDRTLDLVFGEIEAGRTIVGYAASAKSCTMLNYLCLGPSEIAYVLDATPAKDGRYTPGSGIPITTTAYPDPQSTTYLLLAHNYLPAVLRRERRFFESGGRMIVPLPLPVVI